MSNIDTVTGGLASYRVASAQLGAVVSEEEIDRRLLERIAHRDNAAFESFYRRHYSRVHRFVSRTTRRPELTEEVVNEAMMVVWEGAAGFRGDAKPVSWLLGIAWRVAIRRLRTLRQRPEELDVEDVVVVDPVDVEAVSQGRELSRILRTALDGLTPAHRAVVELTYLEGHSCEEVARLLECPVGTVKTRMMHARARLRGLLAGRIDGLAEALP